MKATDSEIELVKSFLCKSDMHLKTGLLIKSTLPVIIRDKINSFRSNLYVSVKDKLSDHEGYIIDKDKAEWSFGSRYECFIRVEKKEWIGLTVKIENDRTGFNDMYIGVTGHDIIKNNELLDENKLKVQLDLLNLGVGRQSNGWFWYIYFSKDSFLGERHYETIRMIFFDSDKLLAEITDAIVGIVTAVENSLLSCE